MSGGRAPAPAKNMALHCGGAHFATPVLKCTSDPAAILCIEQALKQRVPSHVSLQAEEGGGWLAGRTPRRPGTPVGARENCIEIRTGMRAMHRRLPNSRI